MWELWILVVTYTLYLQLFLGCVMWESGPQRKEVKKSLVGYFRLFSRTQHHKTLVYAEAPIGLKNSCIPEYTCNFCANGHKN